MSRAARTLVLIALAAPAPGCSRTVANLFLGFVTSPNLDERPIPHDVAPGATVEVRVEGPGLDVLRDSADLGPDVELLVPSVDLGDDRVVTVTVRNVAGTDLARARSLPFELTDEDETLVMYLGRVGRSSEAKTRMTAPRFRHTATLLPDGRVLIAGGGSRKLMTGDAENPVCCAGACREDCNCNCAGSLGDALVVPADPVDYAEIIDSMSASVATTPQACFRGSTQALCMFCGRMAHVAANDVDGSPILGGGQTQVDGAVRGCSWSTERFAGGRFEFAASIPLAVVEATAFSTTDGVVVAGGLEIGEGTPTARAALVTGGEEVELESEMIRARYGAVAASLPDGRGIVFGGFVSTPPRGSPPDCACVEEPCSRTDCRTRGLGPMDVTTSVERYEPATRTFEELEDMLVARAFGTATTLPDGRVLLVGGLGAVNTVGGQKLPITSIEVYDPESGETCEAGDLPEPRWLHAAYATPDGRVVILGGYRGGLAGNVGLLAETIVVLSLRAGCGVAINSLTGLRYRRAGHTATALGNGSVLIAGGVTDDGVVTDTMEVLWLE